MSHPREVVLLAQDLYQRLGPGGIALAETRSDELTTAGDGDGARFWRRISRAMVLIAITPGSVQHAPIPRGRTETYTWSLMQRIEGYRHLADEAEAAAAVAPTGRRDLEALAQGWRELAAIHEQLSGAVAEIMPPEPFSGTIYELN